MGEAEESNSVVAPSLRSGLHPAFDAAQGRAVARLARGFYGSTEVGSFLVEVCGLIRNLIVALRGFLRLD